VRKIDVYDVEYRDLLRGSRDYVLEEKRDAMYRVAVFWIDHFWYHPSNIADGIGVLLLVWNQAFYRYCKLNLNFKELETFLKENEVVLKELRFRDIATLSKGYEETIINLFNSLLDVLKCKDRKSPVAVSKALHLLAPNFFIPWDNDISKAYGCYWYHSSQSDKKYIKFLCKIRTLSKRIITQYADKKDVDNKTARKAICEESSSNVPFMKFLLKIIDEFNYAFTKYW